MGFKSLTTYGSIVAIAKIPARPALYIGITARYFKMEVDAVRTSGGGVQISNLHLYFNRKQVSNSGVVASNIDVFNARGAFTATDMFDENLSTYLYSATEKNIITFTYPADITFNHYDWATAVNNIGRDPVSWRLLYSTDNTTFTLIDQQVNFPTTEIRSKYIPTTPIVRLINAQYFRYEIVAVRSSGSGVQIAEILLYFNGKKLSNSGVVASNLDTFGRGFDAPSVFDDNIGTYLYSATEKNVITFTYPAKITMNQYNWGTAVNNIGGDPISWRLLYSTDNVTFTLLDQQTNFPPSQDRSKYIPIIQIKSTNILGYDPPVARTYKTISMLFTDSPNNVWSNRFDSNGVLYFGGTGFLEKYVNNTAVVVAGNGTLGFSGDEGQATSALMGDIFGIAFDTVGNIYLADLNYHVIRKIDIVSGVISTIAGTGGSAGNSGQGGQATSALLNRARDVLIDSNNNMYIVCSGSNVINKIDTNGIITTIAGTGTSGYTGDGGQATSCTMSNPAQLSLYKNNLYFADGSNFVVRKIELNTGIITTVVGQGNNTHNGDGGQAILANLQFPRGVVFNNVGNMYISEKPYIRKVDLDGVISTIAGNGANGNTGDGGDPLLATFGQAFTLVFDSNYILYVCDAFNKNIRVLS